MTLLSFVIPCYRSEKTIKKVTDEIINTMNTNSEYDYEIILVNDNSPDGVWRVLKELAAENKKIKVVDFMQNFGKDAAVLAGLSVAKGQIAVTMDDDFQCPAKEVFNLIAPVESGEFDVSAAKYEVKMESLFKRFCSEMYRLCAQSMLGQPKDIRIDNFIALSEKVYKEMLSYKNPYPFLDGLIMRVTKRIALVDMKERKRGDDNSTGFTFAKSMKMFMDGLTAFSIKPLRFASIIGFGTAIIGFVYLVITIVHYFTAEVAVGFSSLMSVLLFVGGMLMMMIGMMGEYIGRIYICINQSPQYVIRQTINLDNRED